MGDWSKDLNAALRTQNTLSGQDFDKHHVVIGG
jgi:hypothetical protein